jgi:hypothetical protein
VLKPKVKAEIKAPSKGKVTPKRNMMKRLRKMEEFREMNQGRGGRERHANSLWKLRPTTISIHPIKMKKILVLIALVSISYAQNIRLEGTVQDKAKLF